MTSYEKYRENFKKRVDRITDKYHGQYHLMPTMYTEEQFKAQLNTQKLLLKKQGYNKVDPKTGKIVGKKNTNYVRDIINRQFVTDRSSDKILQYQDKLIQDYMSDKGVSKSVAKKALKSTLITSSDIRYRTAKYESFYKEIESKYWELRDSGLTGTEAGKLISETYFNGDDSP